VRLNPHVETKCYPLS